MPDFWFFLTSTALFDSLSTAVQIIIFVFFFSTRRPLANSLAFMAGLGLAYLGCGLLFLVKERAINAWIAQWFPNVSGISDPQYYLLQLLGAMAFVAGGIFFGLRNWRRGASKQNERLAGFLKILNPFTAALLGVFLSVSGFPFSLPYLGALEKLSGFYGPQGAVPGVLYYNLIYLVPLLVPLGIYLVLKSRVTGIEAKLHLHSPRWGSLLNNALSVVLGLLLSADSCVYFFSGHPLLSSKFF
ncbi:MAG: hypothetical protein HKM06_02715 [Spirochaetales bacterium]|nr:hypothetical protein [Spirochaetales bacterium]